MGSILACLAYLGLETAYVLVAFLLGTADIFLFVATLKYTYELKHNRVMKVLTERSWGGIIRRVFFVLGVVGMFWLASTYTFTVTTFQIPPVYAIGLLYGIGAGLILVFLYN